MSEERKQTFEEAIARLEEVVSALDTGELPLNESLLLYEEGVKLARECADELTEARGKLEILAKQVDGSVRTEDFDL